MPYDKNTKTKKRLGSLNSRTSSNGDNDDLKKVKMRSITKVSKDTPRKLAGGKREGVKKLRKKWVLDGTTYGSYVSYRKALNKKAKRGGDYKKP